MINPIQIKPFTPKLYTKKEWKYGFATLVCFISVSLSFGQTQKIGLSSSVMNSNYVGTSSLPLANSITARGGLSYQYHLKNNIFFGADFLYSRKGYNSPLR